jgi:tetratricopeptide (TPR) repeat protein
VQYGREVLDLVTERGLVAFQVYLGVDLGRCFCRLGQVEEATPYAAFAREADPDGSLALPLQARVHAHRGEHDAAERLAREGVARFEQTDRLADQGHAWWDLAEVFVVAGRTAEACAALEQALDRYERKKNLALVAQVRPRLEALRGAPTST